MNKNFRQALYLGLLVVQAVATACMQQNVIPASWTAVYSTGALVVAMLLKEFGAQDPPKSDE